jgi:hypothetical protein
MQMKKMMNDEKTRFFILSLHRKGIGKGGFVVCLTVPDIGARPRKIGEDGTLNQGN